MKNKIQELIDGIEVYDFTKDAIVLRLKDLLAELGQEVVAVDFPQELKDRVDRLQEKAAKNASSPTHTSEARDAARYRWIVENAIVQWSRNTHIGMDPCSTKLPLDNAIDAAMRQEGGNE